MNSIMKSLCFTLLLVFCCCDAILQAVQYGKVSARCCSKYRNRPLPSEVIAGINKSHIVCLKKGFIVQTVKGKDFCYRQSSEWAQSLYKRFHTMEGGSKKN